MVYLWMIYLYMIYLHTIYLQTICPTCGSTRVPIVSQGVSSVCHVFSHEITTIVGVCIKRRPARSTTVRTDKFSSAKV